MVISSDGDNNDSGEAIFEDLNEAVAESAMLTKMYRHTNARRAKQKKVDEFWFRIKVIGCILSIVAFFASQVYYRCKKFPHIFKWKERAKKRGPTGKGVTNYDMAPMIVASYNPAFGNFMNMLMIWGNVKTQGAKFLLHCIEYFEYTYEHTRRTDKQEGKLTLLHWNGSKEQTGWENLWKENGWLCGNDFSTSDENEKMRSVYTAWRSSAWDQNMWFDFFPKEYAAFKEVKAFKDIVTASGDIKCAGGSAQQGLLSTLFNGGLCAVANIHMADDMTANDLFADLFKFAAPAPLIDCSAMMEEGAVNGALGVGMVAPGLPIPGAVMLPLTVGMAAAGGVVGHQAAEERCKNMNNR